MAARKPRTLALTQLLRVLDIAERVRKASKTVRGEEKRQLLAFLRSTRVLAQETGTTAAGLRSLQRDVLVEWNEGVGPDVEEFWRQVRKARVPIARTHDLVAETLARGRIARMEHYIELEDHFEALQTCGKINAQEAHVLNAMLDAFQAAPKNRQYFDSTAPIDKFTTLPVAIGQLVRLDDDSYRYDYAGMERAAFLQERGYQGGGESWAGITRGLLELQAPELVAEVRFDPEGDCLAVWASEAAPLKKIASLIARAIKNGPLLAKAIQRAEALSEME